jgi:hypothetical protein
MKGFWYGRPSEICDRIIAYAKAHPGSIPVIIRDDPSVIRRLFLILRECGVRKRMFESEHEFVKTTILTSWPALSVIMSDISLSAATPTGERLYWLGTGNAVPYGRVDPSERLMDPEFTVLELQIDQLVDQLKPFLEPH